MRVRERMRGTIGVFVSMAGYTADAVAGLASAGEGSVLLLDRGHLEAMVSGLVPPDELLRLVGDWASFRGRWYAPLHDLLAPDPTKPAVSFNTSREPPNGTLAPGVTASVMCTVQATGLLGMARSGPGRLLLTLDDGIAEVDLGKQTAAWRCPVHGCHGNPVLRTDRGVVFTPRHGVAVATADGLPILGGGFSDR